MEIKRLPALSDNYIFLLHDPHNNTAAVVDPAEAKPVLKCLDELGAKLVAILNPHHHADHVGANKKLMKKFPDVCIYGGKEDQGRIPGQQVFFEEGATVKFAEKMAKVYFDPKEVDHRTNEILQKEAEITSSLPWRSAIH